MNVDVAVASHVKIVPSFGTFTASLSTDSEFGSSVGLVSDLNGDGRAELLIGAPRVDNQGQVFILLTPGMCTDKPQIASDIFNKHIIQLSIKTMLIYIFIFI